MIRVFLLDDHEIVRRGVRELLEGEEEIVVVGEAGTADEALARIPSTRPDVAVLDVQLQESGGVEVCREIRSRWPEIRCLMLTSFADDEAMVDSVIAGAQGYVLKQVVGSDLVASIRSVAAGNRLLAPDLEEKVRARLRASADENARISSLEPRELEILLMVAEGLTNREIGARLYLSEKTVKNQMSRVLKALGMQRRTQAAVFAAKISSRKDRDLLP